MITGLLHLHSSLRYVVIILLVAAIGKALAGWLGRKPYTTADNKLGAAAMGAVHLQIVIGFVLYFISPTVESALSNFGAAMKDPVLRFFAVEHLTLMLVAAVIITVGRVLSKKATDPVLKHRRVAIFYAIGFAAIMSAIPWALRGFYVGMGG